MLCAMFAIILGKHLDTRHLVRGRKGPSTWRIKSDEAATVKCLVAVARCQIVAVACPGLPQPNMHVFKLATEMQDRVHVCPNQLC